MRMLIVGYLLSSVVCAGVHADGQGNEQPPSLVVASLNPIATDLARQVGGSFVRVIELVPPGTNPHEFQLSPGDLNRAGDATLLLAMGKNLEPYLPDLRSNLRSGQELIEIGATIPSLEFEEDEDHLVLHHGHHHGVIDPHWWNSIRNMQRAARILGITFSKADPEHRMQYNAQTEAYNAKLRELEQWTRQQVSRIPPQDRKLATAHAAFNYFCDEFGFQAVPVKGLTTKEEPTPAHLAEVVEFIRENGVSTIFPEVAANPKLLESVAQETGVVVGPPLYAGSPPLDDPTYEAMVRHNMTVIVDALTPKQAE